MKRELHHYMVGVYGLTTAKQVEDFLQRLRWYNVTDDQYFVWSYRPEINSIALCVRPEALRVIQYVLPLMFMHDLMSAFKVDAVYEPKRTVQVHCYNRDKSGRRYRWLKSKDVPQWIDPEPQPVKTPDPSAAQPMVQTIQ